MKKNILYVILSLSILTNLIFVGRKIYYQVFYQPTNVQSQKSNADFKQDIFSHSPQETNGIVFLGNSLTSEFLLSEYFPDNHIKNRGIWGDKTSDILSRINEIIGLQPKKIFMMAGINDLLNNIPNDQIISDIQTLVNEIRTESPETSIYIQSVLPVSREASLKFLKDEMIANSRIFELNSLLSTLYRDENIYYIDLNSAFVLNDELNAQYSWDGVHINGRGYQLWFEQIRVFVENKHEQLLN
jgi:lysophospholipase L1-like esterase